jgi:hypothetical protein
MGQGDPRGQHQGGMKRRFTGISEREVIKLPRRQFLYLAAGVVLPAMSRVTWSQAYPTRPVRLISGFPAGGPSDILARLMRDGRLQARGRAGNDRPSEATNPHPINAAA